MSSRPSAAAAARASAADCDAATRLDGSSDGDGWVEEQVPRGNADYTIEYTPEGEDEPFVLPIQLRCEGAEDDPETLTAHLANMGFCGDTAESSVCQFQAAHGSLEVTGVLDGPTKNALLGLVKGETAMADEMFFPEE